MSMDAIDRLVIDSNLDIDGDIINVDGKKVYIDECTIKQLGGKQA